MPNVTKTYGIGLYLDRAMKDKNISMDELSELTGINKKLLRCYRIYEKNPSLNVIKKLAKALDKDTNFFLEDSFFKEKDVTATLLNTDLISKPEEVNEIDLRYSYKTMSRFVNQIFNLLSMDGKQKFNESLFNFIKEEVCNLAWEDNKDSE